MAWKDNALGIVVDRSMNANYAELKKQGVSFVVIDGGVGWDVNPAFNDQYSAAVAAGLPVLVQYTPIPALDDYVFEAPAREQIPVLKKLLGTKPINGLIISAERYWVGYDLETQHVPVRTATAAAINYTASEFMNTFTKQYAPVNVQVMIRTNDNFVQKYAPDISSWADKFGFVLADWRYRTRAGDGSYSLYTVFPKLTVATLAELRAALPPDGSKNPLVPGVAPQLKFWEFSGSVTIPPTLVKGWDGKVKTVKAVLFNGSEETMKTYLGMNVVVVPPPVDPPPANPGPDHPPPDPVNLPDVEAALIRIVSLCEKMAADLATIRGLFRG